MAILTIVYHPHAALHKVAAPVTVFDDNLKKLIADMYETMYHANGIGLAAPQVALSIRLAVIDISPESKQPFCIINPEIIEQEGREMMEAGCLSVPSAYDKVPRATRVKVRAQNEHGEFFEIVGEGLLAHCLQHEIDHLNGILYIDYLSPLKRSLNLKKMQKYLRNKK